MVSGEQSMGVPHKLMIPKACSLGTLKAKK